MLRRTLFSMRGCTHIHQRRIYSASSSSLSSSPSVSSLNSPSSRTAALWATRTYSSDAHPHRHQRDGNASLSSFSSVRDGEDSELQVKQLFMEENPTEFPSSSSAANTPTSLYDYVRNPHKLWGSLASSDRLVWKDLPYLLALKAQFTSKQQPRKAWRRLLYGKVGSGSNSHASVNGNGSILDWTAQQMDMRLSPRLHLGSGAAGDSGGSSEGGSSGGGGVSGSGSGNKKDNNNKGGGGGEKGGDGEEGNAVPGMEEWLIPRSTLFVIVMFIISGILYYVSLPAGNHTGWASVMKHADEVSHVYLYEHFAQIYTKDAGRFHLGIVDDQHTNEKIVELERVRTAAQAKNASAVAAAAKNGKGKDAGKEGSEGEDSEESSTVADGPLAVHFIGTPMGESALGAFGMFAWMVPFVFFPIFVMILSNSIGTSMMAVMNAGNKTTKVKDMIFRVESASNTRFRDVAGMKEAKKEITEIVDFLKRPQVYTALGAKIPTGALILGPPGTGKTLLAKAVAGESGVGFIPVTGSDFVELYVGMGALRVRQLFKVAKKQRCIVYIDEIDAIGLKRRGAGHGEKQEQEHTLNELLTQLDGFSTGKRGDVMILASSNVDQDQLDPALIRPGRFDRLIHVDPPVVTERIDIFKVHLSKLKLVLTEGDKAAAAAAGSTATSASSTPGSEGEQKQTEHKSEAVDAKDGEKPAAATGSSDSASSTVAASAEKPVDTSSAESPVAAAASESTSAAEVSKPVEDMKSTANNNNNNNNTTESAVIISSMEEERRADEELLDEAKKSGLTVDDSFDIRSKLMKLSEEERTLINAYAERMSSLCPGFVGADIANVCNEAAILAAREASVVVDISHLERSIDRVLAGIEQRSRVLMPFERNVVAHHEAGHAVAGWFLNRADPLMKVSIIPRGGAALGYAQYLPNENRMRTSNEILDSICVTLGGRVAEKIFFNHLSTGASDDLRKVTRMAYTYVSSFQTATVYPAPGSHGTKIKKPFGPKTSNELDEAAKELVDKMYQRTYDLLLSKKDKMEILANHLLEKEMLTYQDVVGYLGTRSERSSDRRKNV